MEHMKILGTTINNRLDWNTHIRSGKSSLLCQIKQRYNTIKIISSYISIKFARTMANALMISKVNYNVDVWGKTNKHNLNKINQILEKAARIVLGNSSIGRTTDWVMTNMKWLKIELKYENSAQNYIYKLINGKDEHNFKHKLIGNRSVRIRCQNKVGHHDQEMGRNVYTQRSILYTAVSVYNKLPRNITLIKKMVPKVQF